MGNQKRRDQILEIIKEHPTLSNREIGKLLGIARSTVSYYLQKENIHRDRIVQQKLNNTCREKILEISDEAEQVILGSILGDGSITKYCRPKDTKKLLNSNLTINHGIKQKEYIEYKKEILERNNIKCHLFFTEGEKIKPHYIKGILVKENGNYTLRTQRNVVFNKYRNIFYSNRKHISRYIYKLKALGLAIWYMDDGYYSNNEINICTNSFSYKEVALLQEILKHNFEIETTIYKSNLGHPILHIKVCSRQRFLNIVTPYICNCLKYKLGT